MGIEPCFVYFPPLTALFDKPERVYENKHVTRSDVHKGSRVSNPLIWLTKELGMVHIEFLTMRFQISVLLFPDASHPHDHSKIRTDSPKFINVLAFLTSFHPTVLDVCIMKMVMRNWERDEVDAATTDQCVSSCHHWRCWEEKIENFYSTIYYQYILRMIQWYRLIFLLT